MMTLAIGLTRWWVRLYTKGLPPERRDARRAEIESDTWEQGELAEKCDQPPFATTVEMVARMLLGVLSDITWRVQAGLSTRSDRSIKMNESLTMRGFFVAAVAIAIAPAAFGVSVIAGGGEWDSTTERVLFGSLWVVAAVTMVAGLILSTRTPRLGIGLVALGAIAMAVLWFWVPFITIPLGAALVFLAYRRARQTGWPHGDSERDRIAPA